jgi:hypothetical protein
MNTGRLGFFHYSPTNEMHSFQPVMDSHLIYIRQMGFEVLSSPELLALTSVKPYISMLTKSEV